MKELSIKKLYYSISEVSRITGIEQYVLRYWESEFENLKPQKNRAGNRIYTNKDIQLILKITSLLRDKKYTIEGARKILEGKDSDEELEVKPGIKETEDSEAVQPKTDKGEDTSLKSDLLELKNILEILLSKL
ncbi:MAG TPA: MerR family transcriptional regulator [Ignavibacteria bacterium]|nr:MerR family transcriptional regulator [Ignavibacteria bacterium]